MSFTPPFLLGTVFFRTALPCSGGYHMERGGMPLHDAVGINCKKGATTENQGSVVNIYGLRGVSWWLCVCYQTWHDNPSLVEGESHGILLLLFYLFHHFTSHHFITHIISKTIINVLNFFVVNQFRWSLSHQSLTTEVPPNSDTLWIKVRTKTG